MKLNCPYCGETISYDLSLAGRPVRCSYCEHAIKLPTFAELPEELQEEVRQEEARKQEKQKRKYLQKQEQFLKKVEKEEKLKRKEEARQQQQELEQKIQAARKPVPEELAVRKRYHALRAMARWNKVLAGLVLLGYAAYVLRDVIAALRGTTSWSWVFWIALLLAIPTALTALMAWAGGELLQVFLDISDDVRITRLLTKRQVYRKDDSEPQ